MNNLVTVRVNDKGVSINKTKNPEIGYIIFEQKATELKNGWFADKTLSALVMGPMDLLNSMDLTKPIVGKIVVKESILPLNEADLTYGLKYAGNTGVVCMAGDDAIYRTTELVYDLNEQSTFVKHTNGAQIREANSTGEAVESLQAFKEETVTA